jgi:histidine triad (HIT) family protein
MPSYKIAENKKAIAILEINPLTKGHSIIIPLEHTTIDKLSKSSLGLAQKITKKIKLKLKPEDVKIETSSIQGHAIINVIPFYKNQQPEKKKANEEELQKLQSILETKKRSPRQKKEVTVKVSKQSLKGLQKISFRIP